VPQSTSLQSREPIRQHFKENREDDGQQNEGNDSLQRSTDRLINFGRSKPRIMKRSDFPFLGYGLGLRGEYFGWIAIGTTSRLERTFLATITLTDKPADLTRAGKRRAQ